MTQSAQREFSSFRDPSGVVFTRDGVLLRQVNSCYKPTYDMLMESGLYQQLVKEGLMVAHQQVDEGGVSKDAYCVIRPQRVPYISYPYEWAFGMLKDAALVTLRCHRAALEKGMILKDASAYNIQFMKGNALLIDTLSFEKYPEGMPWVAYGQFCRHFLAPLLLMKYTDLRMNLMLREYIDGIPLDLAAKLLGGKGGMFARQHIVWHARATVKHSTDGRKQQDAPKMQLSLFQHKAMIDSMLRNIEKLELPKVQTEWGEYYEHTNYSDEGAQSKQAIVREMLSAIKPQTLWDFGANDGRYSRLGLEQGASVVAFDVDPLAVEHCYRYAAKERVEMLPLLQDLTNPSPAIGFGNQERTTIQERQHPDCILALAVIHHLAISNNLPLEKIALWLSGMCNHLIIEFVPKDDSQVGILLATRDDIFPNYTQAGFEEAFGQHFKLVGSQKVAQSNRVIYHLTSL